MPHRITFLITHWPGTHDGTCCGKVSAPQRQVEHRATVVTVGSMIFTNLTRPGARAHGQSCAEMGLRNAPQGCYRKLLLLMTRLATLLLCTVGSNMELRMRTHGSTRPPKIAGHSFAE